MHRIPNNVQEQEPQFIQLEALPLVFCFFNEILHLRPSQLKAPRVIPLVQMETEVGTMRKSWKRELAQGETSFSTTCGCNYTPGPSLTANQIKSRARLRMTLKAPRSKPQMLTKPLSSASAKVFPVEVRLHITSFEATPNFWGQKEDETTNKQIRFQLE